MSRQVDVKALVSHIVRGDGSDRCRICMGETTEGQVHLEDTVMLDGDKPITLAELLELITGVEVPLDKHLPHLLCLDCSMSTFQVAEFQRFCRKATQHWDKTIKLLEQINQQSDRSFKITAVLDDNTISITEELVQEKPLPLPPKLVQPKIVTTNHKCQCPFCGKQFMYAQHFSQHLKESSDNQRACHICAKIMTRQELVQHLVEVHRRKPYDCKKCTAMFCSHKQYKLHLIKAHKSNTNTCGDCGRSFQSSQAFCAHLSIHNPKNCPQCDQLFRNQKCYRYHVRKCCKLDSSVTHRTKTKVTVMVQNKNKDIKVGMRGSTVAEAYCDYCNKKFAGKKFVAAHIQIVHTKDTHRPCIYCGKLLAAAHMSAHVKRHESNETFQCGHCGVVLKSKLGYIQHLRLHTGEKPYSCQYCNETFSASSRRSEHIRKTHKNSEVVLGHACKLCPARFRLPYRLKKHISSVHGKGKDQALQFECNECHQKFSSCRGLLHHSRKHQQIQKPKINTEMMTCD